MTSITKNSAITFLSRVIIFVLGVAAAVILARVLGPTERGIYALIILIPGVMFTLGTLGIEVANVYFTGSKKYEIKDIVSNSLFCAILFGLILILLFFGIFHLNVFQNFLQANQINSFYLWLAVLAIPFALLFSFLNNVLLGREEIVRYNKANIFRDSLQLIALIIFLLILRHGIFGAILSYVLAIIGVTLFIIFLIRKITKIRPSLHRKLLKDSIIYGIKGYFGNIAQFLNYRLDMFLVAMFLVPTAVGFYSIAVGMAETLWMLPGAIATVLFPRISSLKDSEADSLTPRISRHSFFIIFILSLILALISKPLVKILFGTAFLPSVIPLLILLPGIIALGGARVLTSDLAGRGRPEFGTYAAFVSLAVNIPLNIFLIPKWGISGAALASTIAYGLATIVVLWLFLKISNTSLSSILFIRKSDFRDYLDFWLKVKKKIKNEYQIS